MSYKDVQNASLWVLLCTCLYKVDSTAPVHQLLGSRKSALKTENLLLKELNFVDEVNDQRADNVISLHYNFSKGVK